jgi:glucose uptake protein GlcU
VLSNMLDLLGAAAFSVLAFLIWPPAALGVIGVAALVASWKLETDK